MTVYYISNYNKSSSIYIINETSVGPFTELKDKKELKKYMQKVDSIDVEYYFVNEIPVTSTAEASCYIWKVVQHYDFHRRSSARLTLQFDKVPCDTMQVHEFNYLMYIVIIISSISAAMHIKYLIDIGRRYDRLRFYYKR